MTGISFPPVCKIRMSKQSKARKPALAMSADDSGGKEFRQLRLQKRRDVSGAKSDSSTSAAIMAHHVFELNRRKSTSANKYLSDKYFAF